MSLYRFPVNCHISRLPHSRPHISTPLYSLLSSGLGDDLPVLVKSVSKIRFHGFEGNFFKRKKTYPSISWACEAVLSICRAVSLKTWFCFGQER